MDNFGEAASVPVGNSNCPASPRLHDDAVNLPAAVESNGYELVSKKPEVGREHGERIRTAARCRSSH